VKSTALRIFSFLTIALFLTVGASSTAAQDRLSDKDVANMMNNLKNDAKNFRQVWNHALSKSTIRKTSREKDARTLATQFQNQTEGMLRQFQSNKTADTSLPLVRQTARNIEQVKSDVSLVRSSISSGPRSAQSWTKSPKPSNFLRTEAACWCSRIVSRSAANKIAANSGIAATL
jgi:hypothetical protein